MVGQTDRRTHRFPLYSTPFGSAALLTSKLPPLCWWAGQGYRWPSLSSGRLISFWFFFSLSLLSSYVFVSDLFLSVITSFKVSVFFLIVCLKLFLIVVVAFVAVVIVVVIVIVDLLLIVIAIVMVIDSQMSSKRKGSKEWTKKMLKSGQKKAS